MGRVARRGEGGPVVEPPEESAGEQIAAIAQAAGIARTPRFES